MSGPRGAAAPGGRAGGGVGKCLNRSQFTASQLSLFERHSADVAADAAPGWAVAAWQDAIRRAAAERIPFAADDLAERFDLPSLGPNAAGGLFLRAYRRGVIRRVGYRPSRKSSRSGGVVAIWQGAAR